ncbi:RICIN domain-containing protein [Nonomuraea sp. NPDC050790]|uniref:RICIN domain-containing protein n=1 Tax=Nonomuraea sp. NPDC050790 TaxID=3364371 RepID=UPI00378CADA9
MIKSYLRAAAVGLLAAAGLGLTATAVPANASTAATYYYLVGGGRCLDGNGSSAYMSTCGNGNQYQQWQIVGSGTLKAFKQRATGKCLDASGSRVYMGSCNNSNYQAWTALTQGRWQHKQSGKCLGHGPNVKLSVTCGTAVGTPVIWSLRTSV